jgi:hypothetical protein
MKGKPGTVESLTERKGEKGWREKGRTGVRGVGRR